MSKRLSPRSAALLRQIAESPRGLRLWSLDDRPPGWGELEARGLARRVPQGGAFCHRGADQPGLDVAVIVEAELVQCVRDAVVSRRTVAPTILRSVDVDRLLRPTMARLDHERLVALGLDARGRCVREILLAIGGLTGCEVSPRDVFRRLAAEPIASFVLVHNHPSGDPTPSPDDAQLTERMAAGGGLLGLPLRDHVIIADEGFFSFADAGLL